VIGHQTRGLGAAAFTIWVAQGRKQLRHLQIHTIVQTDIPTGRLVGVSIRRPGVVSITARVVPTKAVAGRRTIATLASGIGSTDGLWPRRHGAVSMSTRVAQQEGVGRHTIATLASRIGKQAGLWPRRHGAVSMRARAVPLEEVARKRRQAFFVYSRCRALAIVPSSGALHL